jgi:hypothetical protein
LLESPGQAVRELGETALRIRKPDLPEPLDRDAPRLAAVDVAVRPDCLHDLRPDRRHRIERAARVLEHKSDFASPDPPPLVLGGTRKLGSAEADRAGRAGDVGGQAGESATGQRLSAAALPHDRERLTGREVEIDAVDRGDESPAGGDFDAEITDLEDGSGAGRRPARDAGSRSLDADQWTDSREFLRASSRSRTRSTTSR